MPRNRRTLPRRWTAKVVFPLGVHEMFSRAAGDTWWQVSGPGLSSPLVLRLGPSGNELVCTGVIMGLSDPDAVPIITASTLRLPLAAIITDLVMRMAPVGRSQIEFRGLAGFPQMLGALAQRSTRAVPRTRPGRRGYPDRFYQQIADEYRAAQKSHPRSPTQQLIAAHPERQPAATRWWVKEARRRGFLQPYRSTRSARPRSATRAR